MSIVGWFFFPNQKSERKYFFILMATHTKLLAKLKGKALCTSTLPEERGRCQVFPLSHSWFYWPADITCSCLSATFAPSSIQDSIYWTKQPWKDRTPHSTNGFIFLVPIFTSTCMSSLPSPPYPPSPRLADAAQEPAALVGITPRAVNGHDAAATWQSRGAEAESQLWLAAAQDRGGFLHGLGIATEGNAQEGTRGAIWKMHCQKM